MYAQPEPDIREMYTLAMNLQGAYKFILYQNHSFSGSNLCTLQFCMVLNIFLSFCQQRIIFLCLKFLVNFEVILYWILIKNIKHLKRHLTQFGFGIFSEPALPLCVLYSQPNCRNLNSFRIHFCKFPFSFTFIIFRLFLKTLKVKF